jgi:hypothetical protein
MLLSPMPPKPGPQAIHSIVIGASSGGPTIFLSLGRFPPFCQPGGGDKSFIIFTVLSSRPAATHCCLPNNPPLDVAGPLCILKDWTCIGPWTSSFRPCFVQAESSVEEPLVTLKYWGGASPTKPHTTDVFLASRD